MYIKGCVIGEHWGPLFVMEELLKLNSWRTLETIKVIASSNSSVGEHRVHVTVEITVVLEKRQQIFFCKIYFLLNDQLRQVQVEMTYDVT